jgi:hypothetical protein
VGISLKHCDWLERRGVKMPLDFSVWQLPTGIAANKEESLATRMKFYRFQLVHKLKDGTRIIPTIETMRYIFQAYDQFNLEVVVENGSYRHYREKRV